MARCARREADRRSPGFSRELHERIMQAVESSEPAGADPANLVPRPGDPSLLRNGRAIAAVLVAASALVILSRGHFDQPERIAVRASDSSKAERLAGAPLPPVAAIDLVPAKVRTALSTAVAEEQFAGIDHDARRMTQYLVDQVPFQKQWEQSKQHSGTN